MLLFGTGTIEKICILKNIFFLWLGQKMPKIDNFSFVLSYVIFFIIILKPFVAPW